MSEAARALRVGAVGPPGRRVFYLEVDTAAGTHRYLVEKEQVAALAAAAGRLLADAGFDGPAPLDEARLTEPAAAEWRVAEMTLTPVGDAAELGLRSAGGEPELTYLIPLPQLAAAAMRSLEIVAAGRTPCPRCGLAVDPEGHICPASNGDLRRHQA